MTNTLAQIERRKHRRFQVQNGAFVVLSSSDTKVGRIMDTILILKNMFRLEPLLGTVRGYLFLKSGHRLFPDRYLNGTVFCTVLTHLQTGCQAYRGRCRVPSL